MVGVAYAVGKYAWAQCGKCGLRFRYLDIKSDGQWRHLRVCEGCYDPRHPQERLKPVSDPVALWRPTTECVWPPEPPVLSGVVNGTTGELTWTAAVSPDSAIDGYRLYRAVPLGSFELIATLPVLRNWIGAIEEEPLAYDDEGLAVGTYQYVVEAYDMRNLSARSNTVELVVAPAEPALPDDIFTLKLLDHFNIIDSGGNVTVVESQYGPDGGGGFNTLLYLDGETYDYAGTGFCLAPAGAARLVIQFPVPLPAEMEYLDLYIEGDGPGGFQTETISYVVGESGVKYTVAEWVNVQLVELQYQDYPSPSILVPATLQLAFGFEE